MEFIQYVRVVFSVLVVTSSAAFAHDGLKRGGASETDACENALQLVLVKADTINSFKGMTEIGIKRLVKAQADLKATTENFNQIFEGMAGIHEMDILTMATGQNNLSLGPPGAAKSYRVTWLIPDIWTVQMHEMMNESAIFGGQTKAGLEAGIQDRNTEFSVVRKKYGMFDEFSNANPQVGASVLSFMNPGERYYTENGIRKKAKTRAIFSTGNATRAQLLKNYTDRGLFTGPAMLNRSIFKAWVPNWLTVEEQARRDEVIERTDHLKSVAKFGSPEESQKASELLKGLESRDIDMDVIEAFAQHAFVASVELKAAVREFTNKFRARINEKIRASDQEHRDDPQNNPLVKTPSAEWTERFRSELLRVIRFSAALDYLRMVDAKDLDSKRLNKPIVLNPLSLWRAMYATTTIGPGENRFNPKDMNVEFNLTRKKNGELAPMDTVRLQNEAKDQLELDELKFMWEEQALFNEIMKGIQSVMSSQAKAVAAIMSDANDVDLDLESQDFEIAVYKRSLKKQH